MDPRAGLDFWGRVNLLALLGFELLTIQPLAQLLYRLPCCGFFETSVIQLNDLHLEISKFYLWNRSILSNKWSPQSCRTVPRGKCAHQRQSCNFSLAFSARHLIFSGRLMESSERGSKWEQARRMNTQTGWGCPCLFIEWRGCKRSILQQRSQLASPVVVPYHSG